MKICEKISKVENLIKNFVRLQTNGREVFATKIVKMLATLAYNCLDIRNPGIQCHSLFENCSLIVDVCE